jgi:hypothetical protein
MDRRAYPRKLLDPIHVTDIKTVDRLMSLAHYGTILNASATGLLIRVSHSDLSPELLRHTRALASVEGTTIMMKIVEMDLEIDGRIVRTRHVEQGFVDMVIDFTDNAPTYWRECLAELLPSLGEIDQAVPS